MRPNPVIAHISEYSLENTVFLQAPLGHSSGPPVQSAAPSHCKPWTMELRRGECVECLSPDGRESLFTMSLDKHIREVKSLWVRLRRRGFLCALVQCFAIVFFFNDCYWTETQGLMMRDQLTDQLLSHAMHWHKDGDSMLPWILIQQKWRNT